MIRRGETWTLNQKIILTVSTRRSSQKSANPHGYRVCLMAVAAERLCGAVGEVGQGRVFSKADSVWRAILEGGTAAVTKCIITKSEIIRANRTGCCFLETRTDL